MGTAIVAAKLPNAKRNEYELVVSTYQMCILFLFNYQKEMTFAEIAEAMGFDDETCKKNLKETSHGKASPGLAMVDCLPSKQSLVPCK